MNHIQNFLKKEIQLPSPPIIAMQILNAVKGGEVSSEALAKIISCDAAMTARILQFANSSFYASHTKAESIERAVTVLGTEALINIALSFAITRENKESRDSVFKHNFFWKRSVTAAVATNVLMPLVDTRKAHAFVTGLLQDIGVLILSVNKPEAYKKVFDEKLTKGCETSQAEQKVFGFDHQAIGAAVLQHWGLSDKIHGPIRYHHRVQEAPAQFRSDATSLHLGDMVSSVYNGTHRVEKMCAIKKMLHDHYGHPEDKINTMIDAIGRQSIEIFSLFDVDPGKMKPYSALLHEANEELGKRNLSNEQLIMELKQSKERAELLAGELITVNNQLRQLVFKDGLTGLYNHTYFQDLIAKEASKTHRYHRPLSLIIFDLDHFKQINDQFGHPTGDLVLKQVGTIVRRSIRDADTAARYGGEEFAVVLPETDLEGALLMGERLRQKIESMQFHSHDDTRFSVTISAGVATWNTALNANSKDGLISVADKALYKAKNQGRNRVVTLERA